METRKPSTMDADRAALEHETGFLLQLAHQRARRAFNRALEPLGIEARHLGVLMALCTDRPLSQKQLGTQLEIDKSAVVLIVDDLERLGLARRDTDPHDRRAYRLRITPKGRKVVSDAGKIAVRLDRMLFTGISKADRQTLDEALSRIIRNCEVAKEGEEQ